MAGKTKILVISRDRELPGLLRENLSENDYEISDTQDDALLLRGILEERFPDLIILDIMMPNLDGVEICLQLRQWTGAPIIMLTTWGAGKGRFRRLNLGSVDYLTEPFDIVKLPEQIKEAFQRNSVVAGTG